MFLIFNAELEVIFKNTGQYIVRGIPELNHVN